MKNVIVKSLVILLTVFSVGARGEGDAAAVEADVQPTIEVVFVLDSTGSMGGLIAAAKEKIWAIANTLATCEPAPDIKMGLVGFRDIGDEYVTKFTDLTEDLDAVYSELMGFVAGGGGDGPESVNQALNEAVTKMSWSKDPKAYKVIFLVGDSPPHMDYENDVKYAQSCRIAAENGLIVNTIQCGEQAATTPIWSDIAKKAEGQFFRVDQAGSAIVASTPFDVNLVELSRELDDTRVYYGSIDEREIGAERKRRADIFYKDASMNAQAQRSIFNSADSGKRNFLGKNELVSAMEEEGFELSEVDEEHLSDELKEMSLEEREGYLAEMKAKRKDIQKEIHEISVRRQKYIEEQIRNQEMDPEESLDWQLYKCIKEQAAKKEIEYKEGPAY